VFGARSVQLTAPPRILKDKHVKLKLRAAQVSFAETPAPASEEQAERSAAAVWVTPRCHPDGAAIRRGERTAAVAQGFATADSSPLRTEDRELRTELRTKITFDALGWHMAERLQKTPLLAGDTVDIAFTIGHNDHPEYGGLELSLRDFRIPRL
jgi:hypothetical protein